MKGRIGFAGYESEDIALYLAYCLCECGKKVVIEDRTEHGMLLRMLETECMVLKNETGEETEYQGIFVTDSTVSKDSCEIVIMLFGYRLTHPKLYECDKLVLVTDGLPAHAALLKKVGQWERKQCLVVRNCQETKHGIRYLVMLTGQKLDEVFCIPWDEKDMRIRYSLGVTEYVDIAHLSNAMKEVIKQLLQFFVPEISDEALKKIGRREKKWGN